MRFRDELLVQQEEESLEELGVLWLEGDLQDRVAKKSGTGFRGQMVWRCS